MTDHTCNPPTIAATTAPIQPDWTCGVCGRVFRDSAAYPSGMVIRFWSEIRGPSTHPPSLWTREGQ